MPEIKVKPKSRRINPRIKDVEVGIRSLRKIKVYPLSMHDQMQLTKIINEALQTFFALDEQEGDAGRLQFAAFMVKTIEDNLEKILKFICPDEDAKKLLKEMDNFQVSEIVKIVYTEHYEKPVKNVTSLFPKEQLESALKRQSQQFAKNIDTSSKTSIASVSKKEA